MANGHGGRRKGAGRPSGSGWRPAVAEMRSAAAQRLVATVGSDHDPLTIALQIASDESLDVQIRLGACAVVLPYMYPKLSASSVDTRNTNINIDLAEVQAWMMDRIERIAMAEQPALVEAKPDDAK